jgi:hypothetical protein
MVKKTLGDTENFESGSLRETFIISQPQMRYDPEIREMMNSGQVRYWCQ